MTNRYTDSLVTRPALIYTRVSTARQQADGVSLEAQDRLCRQRAEQLGLEVVGVFTDAATGTNEDRPGLNELRVAMGALANIHGADAPVVVVYSLSRLSRSQRDLANLIDPRGAGLNIVSATEPFDMSTPMGRAFAGMLGVFAQLEVDLIRERTKDGLAVVKASGKKLGNARIAMETLPLQTKRRVWELTSQGVSQREIAKMLTDEGFATTGGGAWTYDNVGKVQRLPRE